MVYAWNPNANSLSYHGGNRGKRMINFRTSTTTDLTDNRPTLLLINGIAMFTMFGVLFPCKYKIIKMSDFLFIER